MQNVNERDRKLLVILQEVPVPSTSGTAVVNQNQCTALLTAFSLHPSTPFN
jgi:hypothetical protein